MSHVTGIDAKNHAHCAAEDRGRKPSSCPDTRNSRRGQKGGGTLSDRMQFAVSGAPHSGSFRTEVRSRTGAHTRTSSTRASTPAHPGTSESTAGRAQRAQRAEMMAMKGLPREPPFAMGIRVASFAMGTQQCAMAGTSSSPWAGPARVGWSKRVQAGCWRNEVNAKPSRAKTCNK